MSARQPPVARVSAKLVSHLDGVNPVATTHLSEVLPGCASGRELLGHSMNWKLEVLEQELGPLLVTLPPNQRGTFGPTAVRYALQIFFPETFIAGKRS